MSEQTVESVFEHGCDEAGRYVIRGLGLTYFLPSLCHARNISGWMNQAYFAGHAAALESGVVQRLVDAMEAYIAWIDGAGDMSFDESQELSKKLIDDLRALLSELKQSPTTTQEASCESK